MAQSNSPVNPAVSGMYCVISLVLASFIIQDKESIVAFNERVSGMIGSVCVEEYVAKPSSCIQSSLHAANPMKN